MTLREYQKSLTGWRAIAVATCMLTVIGVGFIEITRYVLLPTGISVITYAMAHAPW